MTFHRLIALAAALVALTCSAHVLAYKKLGAGPYYNTNYQLVSSGDERYQTNDGSIQIVRDRIDTVNCSGCDTVYFYSGYLFNAVNTTKAPLCFSFSFKLKAGEFGGLDSWGNGQTYLVKSRQTLGKIAGITQSFGNRGKIDMGYSYRIDAWAPRGKKDCTRA